nr:flavodoxin [[Clostridium] scindens]
MRWATFYFPNYWGTMPMAVFTFLEHFDWSGKTIRPFCTHEGSGMGRSEVDIRRLCRGADIKPGLAIQGAKASLARKEIEGWI